MRRKTSADRRQETIDDILQRAKALEGRSRRRCFSQSDAETFLNLCEENPGKQVRVYAHEGFVANSYNYRSYITYAERSPEGQIRVDRADASRSHGRGSLQTVNNRAA